MSETDMSIQEYDRLEQAHRHQLEQQNAKSDRDVRIAREHRKDTARKAVGWTGVALAVAGAAVGVSYFIYQGTNGPDDSARIEQEREVTCIESGGGWVPKSLLGDTGNDQGLCVYPGKTVSQ